MSEDNPLEKEKKDQPDLGEIEIITPSEVTSSSTEAKGNVVKIFGDNGKEEEVISSEDNAIPKKQTNKKNETANDEDFSVKRRSCSICNRKFFHERNYQKHLEIIGNHLKMY